MLVSMKCRTLAISFTMELKVTFRSLRSCLDHKGFPPLSYLDGHWKYWSISFDPKEIIRKSLSSLDSWNFDHWSPRCCWYCVRLFPLIWFSHFSQVVPPTARYSVWLKASFTSSGRPGSLRYSLKWFQWLSPNKTSLGPLFRRRYSLNSLNMSFSAVNSTRWAASWSSPGLCRLQRNHNVVSAQFLEIPKFQQISTKCYKGSQYALHRDFKPVAILTGIILID